MLIINAVYMKNDRHLCLALSIIGKYTTKLIIVSIRVSIKNFVLFEKKKN